VSPRTGSRPLTPDVRFRRMKREIQFTLLVAMAIQAAGCASPYMIDRGRDAADVVVLSVGCGLGGRIRVGPVHAGLIGSIGSLGLRGGRFGCSEVDDGEMDFTVISGEQFRPFGRRRGKDYNAQGRIPFIVSDVETEWAGFNPYFTQIEVQAGLLLVPRLGLNPGELLDFLLGWTTLDIFGDDVGFESLEERMIREIREDQRTRKQESKRGQTTKSNQPSEAIP